MYLIYLFPLDPLDSLTNFLKSSNKGQEHGEYSVCTFPSMEADHYSNLQMITTDKNIMTEPPYHKKSAFISNQIEENVFTDMSLLFDFDHEKNKKSNRILFLGAPGIGKSFACTNIAYQWGINQLGNWKYVFLIRLSSICITENIIISIFSHVVGEDQHLNTCKTSYTKWKYGEALLILDGWDEISKTKQNWFDKILCYKALVKFDIVVTSRHSASVNLKKYKFNKTIEIIGFDTKSKDNFICKMLEKNECKDIDSVLMLIHDCLKKHPTMNRHSRIPIVMRIICFIFINFKLENGRFCPPQTTAELYEICICNLIKHFLLKHEAMRKPELAAVTMDNDILDKIAESDMSSLQKILENTNHKDIKKNIGELSKLAFHGLMKNQSSFITSNEYDEKEDSLEFGIKINILQRVKINSVHGTKHTLHFAHLTVQEYLSAVYLSYYSDENDREEYVNWFFWEDSYFTTSVIYCTLDKIKQPILKQKLQFQGDEINVNNENLDIQQFLKIFMILKESKKEALISILEKSEKLKWSFEKEPFVGCVKLSQKKLDSSKYLTFSQIELPLNKVEIISYFLENCKIEEWLSINFRQCLMENSGLEMLHLALTKGSKKKYIQCLNLTENRLSELSIPLIDDIVYYCSVENLWISSNHFDGTTKFKEVSNLNILKSLYVRKSQLQDTGVKSICQRLVENKDSSLETLDISDNACTEQVANFLQNLLKECKSLTELHISNNELKDVGIIQIFQTLQSISTLKELHASNNSFGDQAASAIGDCFAFNKSLKIVSLNENYFTFFAISSILKSILKNKEQILSTIEICPCQQLNSDEQKQISELRSEINNKRCKMNRHNLLRILYIDIYKSAM